MSNTVDNRVVELNFDNSKFERNASQSIETLGRLNKTIDKSTSEKPFNSLNNSIKGIGMNGLITAVETVADRFSTLGIIGVTALQNITNRAVDAGIRIAKSLSIDQVTAGWSKYEQKTTAVQTIMAATADQFEDQGAQMEYVNGELEKLNWFTDETSYNFVDMVSNIGKFTSQGQRLDQSNVAMQGIATWAAVSGRNASAASRAMYNLSQALSVGSVKLMDWRSIENVNMATKEFKETVLETAVEVGALKKTSDGLYKTSKGVEVSFSNFSQTLSEGWFNSETLMKSLEKYGGFANELYKDTKALDLSATDMLKGIDAYTASSEEFSKWAEEAGHSIEELTPYMEELTKSEYDLGRKAFKAAQEAKTFSDAMDAIKDGVSTSWMNLFETIFGNYLTAKTLWTNLANEGYELFAEPVNKLTEFVQKVKDIPAAVARIQISFKNLSKVITGILNPAFESFKEVFPSLFKEIDMNKINDLIKRFVIFTRNLKVSDDTTEKLRNTFKGFFTVIKSILTTLGNLKNLIKPISGLFVTLASKILNVTSAIGEWIISLSESENKLGFFETLINAIGSGISWLSDILSNFSISGVFNGILDFFNNLLQSLGTSFDEIKETIKQFNFGSLIMAAFGTEIGIGILKIIKKIKGLLDGSALSDMFSPIKETFEGLTNTLKEMTGKIKVQNLLKIAGAIVAIAVALAILANIPSDKILTSMSLLVVSAGVMAGVVELLVLIAKSMKKVNPKTISKLSGSVVKIALAMVLLGAALKIFSTIGMDQIGQALLGFGATLAIVIAGLFLLSLMGKSLVGAAAAVLIVSAAMIVLAGALALFALVVQMPGIEDGLFAMAMSLGIVCIGLLALSNVGPKVIVAAAAIAIVSAALILLAAAFAAFSAVVMMPGFEAGLLTMAISLGVLCAALMLMSTVGLGMITAAAALLIMSVAMIALGVAMAAFAAITMMPGFQQGILVMATALMALILALGLMSFISGPVLVSAAALAVLGVALIAISAAFLIFVVSINLLTPALVSLQAVDMGSVALGFIELAGAFILLGAAGIIGGVAAPFIMLFAVALLMLAPAINIFAPAVQMLEAIDMASIALGLAELAGAFALFDAALAILTVLSPALIIASEGFLKIGQACLDAGTGAEMFSNALNTINDIGLGFVAVAAKVGSAGKDMAKDIASGLSEANPQIATLIANMTTIGSTIGENLVNGFKSESASIVGAARSAISGASSAVRSYYSSMYYAGQYTGQGIADGISSKYYSVYSAAYSLGEAAVRGYKDYLAIASPSKVMIKQGEFTGEAPAIGILNKVNDVYNASSELGSAAIDGFSEAVKDISKLIETDDEYQPRIVPVLDLSEIQNGITGLKNISGRTPISVNSTFSRAQRTFSDLGSSASTDKESSGNTYNTFNQYNNSPKALSRIEIYRQTKNLISAKV